MTPTSNESISHNTLVSDVTDTLCRMIDDGKIKSGEYFPSQKELAAQLGVGLSTIREAFQKLVAMELVQSRPGKGTWVTAKPIQSLIRPYAIKTRLGELHARQVYEARSVIEVALTKFAAQRASVEEIQHIKAAIQSMENAQDDHGFVDADLDFHFAVAAAGHNNVLEQFYSLVRQLLSEIITEMVALPDVKENSIRIQRQIAMAIEKADVEKAELFAIEHMKYIEDLLNFYE